MLGSELTQQRLENITFRHFTIPLEKISAYNLSCTNTELEQRESWLPAWIMQEGVNPHCWFFLYLPFSLPPIQERS